MMQQADMAMQCAKPQSLSTETGQAKVGEQVLMLTSRAQRPPKFVDISDFGISPQLGSAASKRILNTVDLKVCRCTLHRCPRIVPKLTECTVS